MKRKLITISLILIAVCFGIYFVQAISINKVTLVKFADPVHYVSYNGKTVGYSMVGHVLDGVKYPAYCIEPNKDGVFETSSYDVTIEGQVQDNKIVNIIRSGYPYKTFKELGLNNEHEAYYATKTALWCYVNSRDINDYLALSSEYECIMNAIKNIYYNGIQSSQTIAEATLNINSLNEIHIDEIDNKYFSKSFNISSNYTVSSYNVSFLTQELPEGTIISDKNNMQKTEFTGNEEFKILIPIDNIKEDVGIINLNIIATIKTAKVLFGNAPDNLQDHAVTIMAEEEIESSIELQYEKIYGTIKIIKTSSKVNEYASKGEGEYLANAKFEIRNKNKELIEYLITNDEGIAISQKLERGTYYIKEVEAPNYYINSDTEFTVEILEQNQEVELNITDENVNLEVSINKAGPAEAKCGEIINYTLFEAENKSNVVLDKLKIIDYLPIDVIRIQKINTGIWTEEINYSVKYRTNLQSEEILFEDGLNSLQNYELDFSIIELKESEIITQVIFEFANVPVGFKQEEKIKLEGKIIESGIPNDYIFQNIVTIEGEYLEKKVQDEANCKTIIYTPVVEHPVELPKTGKMGTH